MRDSLSGTRGLSLVLRGGGSGCFDDRLIRLFFISAYYADAPYGAGDAESAPWTS